MSLDTWVSIATLRQQVPHGRPGLHSVRYPFFGPLIRDCLDRTQTAMTQERALKAAQFAVQTQDTTKPGPCGGPGFVRRAGARPA